MSAAPPPFPGGEEPARPENIPLPLLCGLGWLCLPQRLDDEDYEWLCTILKKLEPRIRSIAAPGEGKHAE